MWSQQLFIILFQLAELIVISKLCRSTLSNCRSCECQTVTHHNTMASVFLSGEHAFPEFVTWLITYFQRTCSYTMVSNCPLYQWLSIRFLWWQHTVISLMKRDPKSGICRSERNLKMRCSCKVLLAHKDSGHPPKGSSEFDALKTTANSVIFYY